MKKNILTVATIAFTQLVALAQVQPQGEYHKAILKKTNEIRKKTKPANWLNKGVIMFSKTEINRLVSAAAGEKQMATKFTEGETIYGRAFLTVNVGKLERQATEIITRFTIDGKKGNAVINYTGENMIDANWSSWMYIFPEDATQIFEDLEPGDHVIKLEIWTTSMMTKTTTYVDQDDNKVGKTKEDINMGQFIGAGEFIYTKL